MLQAPKSVPQQAIKNLGAFFDGRSSYPAFKAKDRRRESFRPDNDPGTFRIEGRRIKLPRIGWVRLREALRFGKELNPVLKSVTISREAGRWFAAVAVEIDHVIAHARTCPSAAPISASRTWPRSATAAKSRGRRPYVATSRSWRGFSGSMHVRQRAARTVQNRGGRSPACMPASGTCARTVYTS